MISRRDLLGWTLAGTLAPGGRARARDAWPALRPPKAERAFVSAAVEAKLAEVKAAIGDPELAWLFENCYPNTLDTTVRLGRRDGRPDTFLVTGDINCLWLRDSAAQVWPYLPLAGRDEGLRLLFRGLIHRHASCILIDSYANAFLADPKASTTLRWALHDLTEMKPGVAERKWEIDSLCYPIRLAHGYWTATRDEAPFDEEWLRAMRRVVETFREQQRLTSPGPYRFQRPAEAPTETLPLDGFGNPTRKIGLIHSMFRPSDDACLFPFFIPGNLFAARSLRQLAELAHQPGRDPRLAEDCAVLAGEIEEALARHGRMRDSDGQEIWAYEVDGFGNALFMDDANIPSLLGLPYLGLCSAGDRLYRRTRARAWSPRNPYFFEGSAGEGIGGPHEGLRMIWPMSVIMRALTSDDDAEILGALRQIKRTHAGTGFIHESFDQDEPAKFTRPWFAWANSLFGEWIVDLHSRKPALLKEA